jgi:DNA-binding NarL/FixJ family response regulator
VDHLTWVGDQESIIGEVETFIRSLTSSRVTPTETERLSSHELEVLRPLAVGWSNKQIADALFISPKTAGAHVSSILLKLGVARRAGAAAAAQQLGLLKPTGGDGGA